MAKPNKIETVKDFSTLISKKIKNYFGNKKDIPIELIIEYLCRNGILRPEIIRDYMIIDKYPESLRNNNNCGYKAVMDLSIKYEISERTIKYKIYADYHKFLSKNNISIYFFTVFLHNYFCDTFYYCANYSYAI